MALHLSVLLLFTGVTGIHSIIQTVSKVPVKEGRSISVPCLYESKYKDHVKSLCRGYYWDFSSIVVKTNQRSSSGKFSISDDKHQRIFTVTFNNPSVGDTHYWCAVEKNGQYHRKYFQLSVSGSPQLSVDHQKITGFNRDNVSIHFKYSISGTIQWCRLGGSCVKEPSGSMDGTRVTIKAYASEFTVTLSGLRTESSGWYLCTKGDLQMPVNVTVKERPSTTTTQPNTTTTSSNVSSHTSEPVIDTAVSANKENRSSSSPLIFIVTVSLALLIFLVASFIWFMLMRHKQTNVQSSAATDKPVEEVTYSTVKHTKKTLHKAEEEVAYSTVKRTRKTHHKAKAEVTYSTVQRTRKTPDKAEEEVTYSAVKHTRKTPDKPEEEVAYSTVKHMRKTHHKADAENVDVSTLAL